MKNNSFHVKLGTAMEALAAERADWESDLVTS